MFKSDFSWSGKQSSDAQGAVTARKEGRATSAKAEERGTLGLLVKVIEHWRRHHDVKEDAAGEEELKAWEERIWASSPDLVSRKERGEGIWASSSDLVGMKEGGRDLGFLAGSSLGDGGRRGNGWRSGLLVESGLRGRGKGERGRRARRRGATGGDRGRRGKRGGEGEKGDDERSVPLPFGTTRSANYASRDASADAASEPRFASADAFGQPNTGLDQHVASTDTCIS